MVRDDPRMRTIPLPGALAAVVFVAVLLMAIASLQGVPVFRDIALRRRQPGPTPPHATQEPGGGAVGQIPDSPLLGAIVVVIEIVIVVGFLALMAWLFWRVARALWARRPLDRQAGSAFEAGEAIVVAGDEAVDAETIHAAAADAQQTIDAHRDPGDAVVAAWVQLEEASARAGRERAASETAGEFAARILNGRPGLGPDVVTLLALYESVRFGGASVGESDRATARRCLAAIEEGWR